MVIVEKKLKKQRFVTFLCLLIIFTSFSCPMLGVEIKHERLLSFENEIPNSIRSINSDINLSKNHYKDGSQSLKWTYKHGAELILQRDMFFEEKTQGDNFLSTFSAWVYNNKASDKSIEFIFYKDGNKKCSFSYSIDFTGWRAIYVSYERDMEGKAVEGMNELRIISPEEEDGELFFDMILTGSKVDPRHHTPDRQQPFVNKGVTNHWQTMLYRAEVKPDADLYYPNVIEEDKQATAIMEKRLKELIASPTKVTDKKIDNLENKFTKYKISRKNGGINGLSLFYTYYSEAFQRLIPHWTRKLYANMGQEYKEYFDLMQQIANNYIFSESTAQKERLEKMFLDMYDHAKDQGIAYGSGMGNFSHYGYSLRGFFTSYFLMKDVLQRNKRLKDAYAALQWYAQVNEVFVRPAVNGQNMDAFNTLAIAKACSILMMDDSPEKLQYLRAYSRWIDTGCRPSPGLQGAFKIDGGAFHHVGHYPAYAIGGLDGVTKMIYVFHATPFSISEYGHQTIKNVLLAMRFYCNTTNFPLALSGRHPDGKGQLIPIQFARMAVSGSPNGKNAIDNEMAAAYLRLVETNEKEDNAEYMPKTNKHEQNEMIQLFRSKAIKPEINPNGNIAMGYACLSAHRRSNWAAVAKGHSRYLWASEHYVDANFYGRYLAYGSLQIMTNKNKDEPVTPKSGGWVQEGFNWARIPGATAINLPLELLRAPKEKSEMLFSDEAFAGGIAQDSLNGAFGMKLHEHDRYNGSHRALKSYHFFGSKIICLGSEIENINNQYNTETTIFQLAVSSQDDKNYWSNYKGDTYWHDHIGNSYYIPNNTRKKLVFEKNFPQASRYQNNAKPNSGDWVNLVINHGKKPQKEEYEYVIMPQTNLNDAKKISLSYTVLQKDNKAHIVKDKTSATTSFVLFETPRSVPSEIISSVDTASLVMLQEREDGILLTVANPDLAFYRGPSQEMFDKEGKRLVLNIYSRPWNQNESKPVPVTVRLKGKWYATDNDGYIKHHIEENETTVKFMCQHGRSINVKLQK